MSKWPETRAFSHSKDEVRSAKAVLNSQIGNLGGITGVGIGMTPDRDDYAITVTVQTEDDRDKIPSEVEGVMVHVVVSGDFSAT